jgi:hypothetical protein
LFLLKKQCFVLFFIKCAKFELFFTEHSSSATHGTLDLNFLGVRFTKKRKEEFYKERCHIKALDNGDLVFIIFGHQQGYMAGKEHWGGARITDNRQCSQGPCFSTCQNGPIWPNVVTLMLHLCTKIQHQCYNIEHFDM